MKLAFLALAFSLFLAGCVQLGPGYEKNLDIHFFYAPGCSYSAQQKIILEEIEEEFPDYKFYHHDTTKKEDLELFMNLLEEQDMDTDTLKFPTMFIRSKAYQGVYSKQELRQIFQSK